MATDDEAGLKFSLRLSGETADQVRLLAEARGTTPYRVVKDVLKAALPAALADEPALPARIDEVRESVKKLQSSVASQGRQLTGSVEFQMETLWLLRELSEELSGSRDQTKREALWRRAKQKLGEAKARAIARDPKLGGS